MEGSGKYLVSGSPEKDNKSFYITYKNQVSYGIILLLRINH